MKGPSFAIDDRLLESLVVEVDVCNDLFARVRLSLVLVNIEEVAAVEASLRFAGLRATVTTFAAVFDSGRWEVFW
jgi:hypothetical protein